MPPAGDPGAAGGLAARVAAVTGAPPRRVQPAGGQHRWQHCRVTLATGEQAFAKVAATGLDGVFEAEAAGLRWLADAGAVPVPRVLGAGPGALVVSWVDGEPASQDAAERFGRDLARLHAAGADSFGAPWAGFIASLPLPNEPTSRAGPGRSGTRPAGCCRSPAGRWTPARSARTAPGWSRRWPG